MRRDISRMTIREIREHFLARRRQITPNLLQALRNDGRKGVFDLALVLEKRIEKRRAERRRIDKLLHFENELWKDGLHHIAGVDEAGVGPLAGPVVAAAVSFRPGTRIDNIDDSKQLDSEMRQELAEKIEDSAQSIGIAAVEVETIDKLNIYHAALLAMRQAVEQLDPTPEHLLIDARQIPGVQIPQESILRGDSRCFSIAAASILAKTYRDRLMEELDRAYPVYGFAEHKGYPTEKHQAAIRQNGLSPAHRRSFSVLDELLGKFSTAFYEFRQVIQDVTSSADLNSVKEDYSKVRQNFSRAEKRKIQILLRRRMKTLSDREAESQP